MINYKTGNIRFNFRIAGVTVHKKKVLLHRTESIDFWTLPGGRCELLENTRETLLREYFEETGLKVTVGKPLWFLENFFDYHGEKCHEISVIYKVDFHEEKQHWKEDVFYGKEGDEEIIFKWFNFNEIKTLELYPSFLRNALCNIPETMEHIIHKDN